MIASGARMSTGRFLSLVYFSEKKSKSSFIFRNFLLTNDGMFGMIGVHLKGGR